jgi:hypothetical protein
MSVCPVLTIQLSISLPSHCRHSSSAKIHNHRILLLVAGLLVAVLLVGPLNRLFLLALAFLINVGVLQMPLDTVT